MSAKRKRDGAVLIVGLGRFGGAVAETLHDLGHDVIAVDFDAELVQTWSGKLTHVVQVDSTNEQAMRQIGAHECSTAVIAIGTAIEASVLSTSVIADLGIPEIWTKAITASHGKILERLGAGHVVYPERDEGRRVAHILAGGVIDVVDLGDGLVTAKLRAPRDLLGRPLATLADGAKSGLTVHGIKSPGLAVLQMDPDAVLGPNDLLIVSGPLVAVQAFTSN